MVVEAYMVGVELYVFTPDFGKKSVETQSSPRRPHYLKKPIDLDQFWDRLVWVYSRNRLMDVDVISTDLGRYQLNKERVGLYRKERVGSKLS